MWVQVSFSSLCQVLLNLSLALSLHVEVITQYCHIRNVWRKARTHTHTHARLKTMLASNMKECLCWSIWSQKENSCVYVCRVFLFFGSFVTSCYPSLVLRKTWYCVSLFVYLGCEYVICMHSQTNNTNNHRCKWSICNFIDCIVHSSNILVWMARNRATVSPEDHFYWIFEA